jgi:putative ABC transport system permease protein
VVANLVGWPVAWLFMRRWLDGFAYRVDLSPGVFLATASLTCLVAALSVSARALQAALANPIEAIRYE